jgi:hypothetical protein
MMPTIRAWWIPAEKYELIENEHFWPYLNRELGIRLYFGGNQKVQQISKVKNGEYAIIFLDSSIDDLSFLDDFPERSVVVFLVSDETYNISLTIRLLNHRAVDCVYRDYPLGNLRSIVRYPKTIVVTLLQCFIFKIKLRTWFKSLFAGQIIIVRQAAMYFFSKIKSKPLKHIPLGYTWGFAVHFAIDNSLENSESFISFSYRKLIQSELFPKNQESYFSGQRGNFDRQAFLALAERSKLNIDKVYDSFGGPSAPKDRERAEKSYYLGLKQSRFSLCPPGNYSSETFRFLESLLLQSVPLMSRGIISDPLSSIAAKGALAIQDLHKLREISDSFRIEILIANLRNIMEIRQAIFEDLRIQVNF